VGGPDPDYDCNWGRRAMNVTTPSINIHDGNSLAAANMSVDWLGVRRRSSKLGECTCHFGSVTYVH
jgi:hypothetical protein